MFLARPGALSVPLEQRRSWGECAAAGYRACGRIAVRIDLVEKLAEAIEGDAPPDDAALARLIGRPVRDLAGVLERARLSAQAAAQRGERPNVGGASTQRRKRKARSDPDNAFSALANLLPPIERAAAPPPGRAGLSERQRIDVWLFRARFAKTRAAAARLITEGGVRIVHDGAPRRLEKPSVEVAVGDALVFPRRGKLIVDPV